MGFDGYAYTFIHIIEITSEVQKEYVSKHPIISSSLPSWMVFLWKPYWKPYRKTYTGLRAQEFKNLKKTYPGAGAGDEFATEEDLNRIVQSSRIQA